MTDSHEATQPRDIDKEFHDTFQGTEVESIFATAFSPDTPNAYNEPDFQHAYNLAVGDEEKALRIYETWCRFDQAMPVIHHASREDSTIDAMIHRMDILLAYTHQQINDILEPHENQ